MELKLTKKQKKQLIGLVISVIIVVVGLITGTINKEELKKLLGIEQTQQSSEGKYKVIEVTDGDTFKIEYNGKESKVRLIGVDTPESVHPDKSKNTQYGKKASNYTKELIEGKYITIEFDVSETDQYGRLLVYAYLEDGTMLNKKLLEEGYAKIATYPPNVKYVEDFTKIQEEARKNKKGFWSEDIF